MTKIQQPVTTQKSQRTAGADPASAPLSSQKLVTRLTDAASEGLLKGVGGNAGPGVLQQPSTTSKAEAARPTVELKQLDAGQLKLMNGLMSQINASLEKAAAGIDGAKRKAGDMGSKISVSFEWNPDQLSAPGLDAPHALWELEARLKAQGWNTMVTTQSARYVNNEMQDGYARLYLSEPAVQANMFQPGPATMRFEAPYKSPTTPLQAGEVPVASVEDVRARIQ